MSKDTKHQAFALLREALAAFPSYFAPATPSDATQPIPDEFMSWFRHWRGEVEAIVKLQDMLNWAHVELDNFTPAEALRSIVKDLLEEISVQFEREQDGTPPVMRARALLDLLEERRAVPVTTDFVPYGEVP